MTRQIALTQGKIALVEDSDYETYSRLNWYAKQYGNTWYAVRQEEQKTVYMHRKIMGVIDGMIIVDHINGNGLDNRRSNLRKCTRSENQRNRPRTKANTSGYKGVCFTDGKYRAQIQYAGKTINIGAYSTADEAARAYDKKAAELFGDFAYLNFPEVKAEQAGTHSART